MVTDFLQHHTIRSTAPSRRYHFYTTVQQAIEGKTQFFEKILLWKWYARDNWHQVVDEGEGRLIRLECRAVNPVRELLEDWMEDLDRGRDSSSC